MLNILEIDYSYRQYIMFIFMKENTSTPVYTCECYVVRNAPKYRYVCIAKEMHNLFLRIMAQFYIEAP
jgi:hypothetical protein